MHQNPIFCCWQMCDTKIVPLSTYHFDLTSVDVIATTLSDVRPNSASIPSHIAKVLLEIFDFHLSNLHRCLKLSYSQICKT